MARHSLCEEAETRCDAFERSWFRCAFKHIPPPFGRCNFEETPPRILASVNFSRNLLFVTCKERKNTAKRAKTFSWIFYCLHFRDVSHLCDFSAIVQSASQTDWQKNRQPIWINDIANELSTSRCWKNAPRTSGWRKVWMREESKQAAREGNSQVDVTSSR